MEWPKLKNIILLILLLVNGFLLILIGGQRQRARNYEKTAVTQAAQVLEQNGITISPQALAQAEDGIPAPMTAARDAQREDQIAAALLGQDAVCTDRSGGLYAYSGSGGTAVFRANGDFTAALSPPENGQDGESLAARADALLKAMEIESEHISEDGQSVTCRQLLNGIPLYNCRIVFTLQDDGALSIQGTLLTGGTTSPAPSDSGDTLDVSTALIRLLEGILDRRDLCSAITALRPGYLSTQSFGSTTLTPVWLVSTNISDYYLNGVTGELTPVT